MRRDGNGKSQESSIERFLDQGVKKQASGRQPRRAAFWKAQHIHNM
jgi:hypothetical protein